MPYALDPHEPIGLGLRRVLSEQTGEALRRLDTASGDDLEDAVHESRKALKKSRAALRMARPSLGPLYGKVNATLRDVGRSLSEVRDAHVLVQTVDKLAEAAPDQRADDFVPVRRILKDRSDQMTERAVAEGLVDRATGGIRRAESAVDREAWDQDGWKVIGAGLERSYRRGRTAFAAASTPSNPRQIHEWRKRSKDLWYQLRLVRAGWDRVLKATAKEAHLLCDLLGDEHDLAVLNRVLEQGTGTLWDPGRADSLTAISDAVRADLLAAAVPLGRRLYAEKPGRFAARIGRYWKAAASEPPTAERKREELAS
jgi:CHAD domain-containing protein